MTETKTMKEQLLELINGMEEEGFDFDEESAVFQWVYEEKPFHVFTMTIDFEDQAQIAYDVGELH